MIDLEESPESEPNLPEKKKQKNTPIPLPPSSPQKFDFVYGEHSDFILPDFGSEPVDPCLHENPLVPKYFHVKYDPELFNPQQFDYGSSDDHSPTQEPHDEHIPEVLTTSSIPSVISQLRKKNKNIRKLKAVLRSYEQTQQEQDLLLVETETYNEQWRAYSLKLL